MYKLSRQFVTQAPFLCSQVIERFIFTIKKVTDHGKKTLRSLRLSVVVNLLIIFVVINRFISPINKHCQRLFLIMPKSSQHQWGSIGSFVPECIRISIVWIWIFYYDNRIVKMIYWEKSYFRMEAWPSPQNNYYNCEFVEFVSQQNLFWF